MLSGFCKGGQVGKFYGDDVLAATQVLVEVKEMMGRNVEIATASALRAESSGALAPAVYEAY